jgi:hypothetical protein
MQHAAVSLSVLEGTSPDKLKTISSGGTMLSLLQNLRLDRRMLERSGAAAIGRAMKFSCEEGHSMCYGM